jgi:hypothetical protein
MRTVETCGQLDGRGMRTEKGGLDPENHAEQARWRTRRGQTQRRNARLGMSGAEFSDLGGGHFAREAASCTDGRGEVLRPLTEATLVLILARQPAGSHLDQSSSLGVVKARATRMTRGHGVVLVSGLALRRLQRRMSVPGMHEEHRSQGHLRPSDYDDQKRRRNGLLQHAASV